VRAEAGAARAVDAVAAAAAAVMAAAIALRILDAPDRCSFFFMKVRMSTNTLSS
jgi:hypothetical protein